MSTGHNDHSSTIPFTNKEDSMRSLEDDSEEGDPECGELSTAVEDMHGVGEKGSTDPASDTVPDSKHKHHDGGETAAPPTKAEQRNEEAPREQSEHSTKQSCRRGTIFGLGAAAILFLVIASTTVGILTDRAKRSRKSDDVVGGTVDTPPTESVAPGDTSVPTSGPTLEPTSVPIENETDFLKNVLKGSEVFLQNDERRNSESPQFKAFEWMIEEDELTQAAWEQYQGITGLPVLPAEELLERYAAAVLFFSLGMSAVGSEARLLDPSLHTCDWHATHNSAGFSCSSDTRRILQLKFDHSGIAGRIPAEIGMLTMLSTIESNGNAIEGFLPSEMGKLKMMRSLVLSQTQISGSFPSEFFGMRSLETLSIYGSWMTGSLSGPGFANLAKLQSIDIVENFMTGKIPEEIASLSDLSSIILENSMLSSSIPPGIWSLPRLNHVNLRNNHLVGSLPSEIGNGIKLSTIFLSDNRLSGTIPRSISNLSVLSHLYLQNNRFSGQVPEEIGLLDSCFEFLAHDNQISGTLPPSLGSMMGLGKLALHNNDIDGPLPSELASIPNLYSLSLNNNNLIGTVPKEYAQLSSIVRIYLHSNELVGSVDEQFCQQDENSWPIQVLGMEYCESAESYEPNGSLECSCCTECCDVEGYCYSILR